MRSLRNKPNMITLFAGCGGMDEGAKRAGFQTLLAVDNDSHSCATFIANNPDAIVEQKNMFEYTGNMMLLRAGLKPGELDYLHSSAPCTGNSTANPNRSVDLKVNELLWRITPQNIYDFQPKVFTIENTTGLLGGELLPLFFKFQSEMNRLLTNYTWDFKVLNALDYGCPTVRKRMIVIGVRNDVSTTVYFPEPTTKDYTSLYAGKIVPELKWIYSGYRFPASKKKLASTNYMNTITRTQNIKVSTVDDPNKRWLNKRELLLFNGFREDFLIDGTLSLIQARIGNAVPPPLSYAVCKTIADKYFDGKKQNTN